MGSCISVQHKGTESAAARLRVSISNDNDGKVSMNSAVKEDADLVNDGDLTAKRSPPGPRFTNGGDHVNYHYVAAGSKEEGFFDSQPWLDSDCEEDYFSVNGGDLTPSRGTTPVHHAFQTPSSPSSDSKKRLSELFQESLRSEMRGEVKAVDKSFKSTKCCIPKLVSSRSTNGRKKED